MNEDLNITLAPYDIEIFISKLNAMDFLIPFD